MSKRVLILGAGGMQIPAITAAHELGWYVAVADGNAHAVGASLADEFRPVDLKDVVGLLAFATELQKNGGLDGVFTAGTDFSASVSYITEKLGLPGHSYVAACNATVKSQMRRCFAAAGVPSPAFVEVTADFDLHSITIPFPLVVKPVDNMGARGCRLVSHFDELSTAVTCALTYSRSGTAIVEQFMDGPEFSVDALVYNGKVHITGFADRHIYYPPYFIEMGHTMPSSFPQEKITELITAFTAGIHALGLTHGAAKGDLKYTSSGPMIGEIAARLSGGYMSGWTYPYSSGVALTKAALLLACGENPDTLLIPSSDSVCAERAWISMPGTVRSVDGLDKAAIVPGVRDVLPRVATGDAVVFPVNNVEKCGNIIAVAACRSDALFAAEQACREVFIRLEPCNPTTDEFLSRSSSFPPAAYQIPNGVPIIPNGNLQCVNGVPNLPDCLAPYAELTDWNRRSLSSALAFLREYSQYHSISLEMLTVQEFFVALASGGVQAPVYIADSRKKTTMRGGSV